MIKGNGQRGLSGIFSGLYGFTVASLRHDLAAGFLLMAIAVPEQIATARLAGMPAEAGLVAFIAASIGFAIFGANRFLSVGADSTIAPIFAGGLAALAATGSAHYQTLAAILAVMVGIILLLVALFRAGWIADLLSIPVTTGLLAGVAVHIVLHELPPMIGLAGGALSFAAANPYALIIGISACAATLATERLVPYLPGALFAVLLSSGAVSGFHLQAVGLAMMAPLPGFNIHGLDLGILSSSDIVRLVPLALVIALVCIMQTATVVRAFQQDEELLAPMTPNYVGVAVGSILSGIAGAFPVNASPPRTAAVVEGGGRSQATSLIAAAMIVVLVSEGGALFRLVPQAALAGILIAIAVRLFRVNEVVRIARQGGAEIYLVAFSTILVILLPIEMGMLASIVLSLLQSIYGVARPPSVELSHVPGTTVWWPPTPDEAQERLPGVLVFAIGAPVNFTNAKYICRQLELLITQSPQSPRLVVLEASGVVEIDYTGARLLGATVESLKCRGLTVALARLTSAKARRAAERTGFMASIGSDQVFHSVDDAMRRNDAEGVATNRKRQ
jgi:SulP family sulfate permease